MKPPNEASGNPGAIHEAAGTASFAGESVPAPLALRCWLEAAILSATSRTRQDWRTPPTAAEAEHWLNEAAEIAAAPNYDDASAATRRALEQPAVRAGRYA